MGIIDPIADEPPSGPDGDIEKRIRKMSRPILWIGAVVAFALALLDALWPSESATHHWVLLVIIGATAAVLVARRGSAFPLLAVATMVLAISSTWELARTGNTGLFGIGTTIGIVSVLGVMAIATSTRPTVALSMAVVGGIALYTTIGLALGHPDKVQTMGWLSLGYPLQALAVALMYFVRQALAGSVAVAQRAARRQAALSRCSQLLLAHSDPDAVHLAIRELLDATEADYVYVDVNGYDPEGRQTWQIIHEAEGAGIPEGPSAMASGTYAGLETVAERLAAGQVARVVVSEIEDEILRRRYEIEGVRAEMSAPIMIDGTWVGSVGFSDFHRDGRWMPDEESILRTAAEMIGAHWSRLRARDGLIAINEAKTRFIATVSHELRTPLTAVVGFAASLAGDVGSLEPAEVAEYANLIHRHGVEVSNLVNDLLTLERATVGELAINRAPIELLANAREATASVDLGDHRLRTSGSEVVVWADALRVRQIVRNLVTNAGRYGGERIEIHTTSYDGFGQITVSDDGAGIARWEAEQVFEDFYRSARSVTMPESVGLGLAVARRLARAMDGDLEYRRSNGWTRFILRLPLTERRPDGTATDPV